ncbi:HAMP domain-containing protein [Streptomyces mobaraensis NBRC 13819 = DSM 40847]|uniref:histidine kinase n=2 Tax=Streptomyces mobaraensis TaxID=35621 RepID=A0A5N5W8N1_STRMB|nr:two-component system sensor kinase [Streptomyces mobaraensis NBRC 13819 = DSM 40847]KAB7845502.1 HAMP domain-containing protein [Streptomyces mobaraensis]QTT76967.1 HAMP domain-containing protein [Streptomyces mobaraensis NBRC 13819 = DSM 40847]
MRRFGARRPDDRRRPAGARKPALRTLARGLRARLVVAFLLVAALSALATAALTFREARTAILQRTQDTAVNALRGQVNSQAPDLSYPPGTAGLAKFAANLNRAGEAAQHWVVHVRYGDGPMVPSLRPGEDAAIGTGVRKKVQAGIAAVQRVETEGRPWLVIGLPVTFSNNTKPSGVEVFARVPLREDEANVQALVDAAQSGALPAVALAVVPALIAAGGVLRPVRELRRGAQRITEGALDTRLKVTGRDELAELSRTFNGMAAALEENVAELRRMEANARRFAADVSHELRTPLAAMTAVVDVLDEDAATLDPDTAHAVRLISEETGKLARMVEDLMEISRFDAGAAALHLDEVDVAETVRKTLQARNWQDEVEADLPDGVRARLDTRRIDVVVANLVGNALRHGGAPVHVAVRADRTAERLLIEVADQGPGIDPEVLPHVFDRFYKADAARVRSEGSGLGLAITLENVRLHHGTIRAANRPGGGAVFTVDLPLRTGGDEE